VGYGLTLLVDTTDHANCMLSRPETTTLTPECTTSCGRKQFKPHTTLLEPLSGPLASVLAFHGFVGSTKSYMEKQTWLFYA